MQEHARAPLPAVKISPSSAETQAMLAGGHEHAAASSTATHGPVDALRGPQAHAAGLQSQTREEMRDPGQLVPGCWEQCTQVDATYR